MADVVKRGKASIEGVAGTFDALLTKQTIRHGQEFDEETIKDENGFDCAWNYRNEKATVDISCKLLGDNATNLAAEAVYFGPGNIVNLSNFAPNVINGSYHIVSGCEISLANDRVGDMTFKLRKYADATQNTAATSTPS